MVFEIIGFKASETGLQFSFKYVFVDSSVRKKVISKKHENNHVGTRSTMTNQTLNRIFIFRMKKKLCVKIMKKFNLYDDRFTSDIHKRKCQSINSLKLSVCTYREP